MDKTLIPKGIYCYTRRREARLKDNIWFPADTELCPYWGQSLDKAEQECGYCEYLDYGDWYDTEITLLWDQCKKCGINTEEEWEEEKDH